MTQGGCLCGVFAAVEPDILTAAGTLTAADCAGMAPVDVLS